MSLVKTVTLQITGEIRDAAAKIGLIRKDVQALADKSPVGLKAELTGSEQVKVRLKEIEARAERLKKEFPEFSAKLDIGAASAKLAVLRAEIRKTADTGRSLSDRISGIGKALGKATPAWTGFLAAGLALGPALLPVLAAVTGGALGMGAALAGAGAGLGLFAAAAAGNLSELQKQLTKVQAANLAANKAEQTAAGKRTAAQKQAIVNARLLTAAFQKEFGAEANAIEKLKSAWLKFTTQPVVTNAIAAGARLLTAVLPHLTPLLKLGADAVQAFTGALGGFTVGGGLDRLVATLARLGKVGLSGLLAVLHNLAVAFGALSGGAGKFAAGAVGGLVRLSKAFADWAQNKGSGALTGLMTTIRQLGPGVVSLIRNLAAAVPNLAKGLFPLAPLSLALSTALAGIIAHVPPGVITALAVAFAGLYSAVKLAAGITAIMEAKAKLLLIAEKAQLVWGKLVAGATKAWAAAQWLLNAALDANPIGLAVIAIAGLTAGIILAYRHSATFRKIVKEAFHVALAVIRDVWDWIKGNWPLLLTILTGPVGLAVTFIVRHWAAVTAGISAVLSWIRGNWRLLLGILTGPVGAAVAFITGHWDMIRNGARAVLSFFRTTWKNLTGLLEAPFQVAVKVIKAIWDKILGWIHGITGFLGGHGGGDPGGSAGANMVIARRMMPAWSGGANWASWVQLNNRESGWNRFAENPQSGAYGIPQALPATKMPFAAQKAGGSNASAQIGWQIGYIRQRYTDPIGAWAHEMSHGWYGDGLHATINRPTVIGVGERGAERVDVTPVSSYGGRPPRIEILLADIRDLLRSVAAQSAATTRALGGPRIPAPRPRGR